MTEESDRQPAGGLPRSTPPPAGSEPGAGGAEEAAAAAPEGTLVTRRRAPRYRAFGVTGAVIGVLVGLALAFSQEADDGYSMRTIAGYFAVALGMVGALLGLGVAVLAERRRRM